MESYNHLWEILVPTHINYVKIELYHHKEWHAKVIEITGNKTILSVGKGIWLNDMGAEYQESMIPVQISCDRRQISRIAEFTALHYKQKVVHAYLISNESYIYEFDDEFKRILT